MIFYCIVTDSGGYYHSQPLCFKFSGARSTLVNQLMDWRKTQRGLLYDKETFLTFLVCITK